MSPISIGPATTAVSSLLLGLVLGGISRLILGARSTMSMAGSVLAGIVGAGLGGAIGYLVVGSGRSAARIWLEAAIAVAGTVAVLAFAERFLHRHVPSVRELIDSGESSQVELKSTARHNVRTGQRDDRMELVIAKTVAGFLNGRGGTLLIGVDDSGAVLGLADDLPHMKAPDTDRYELWLRDYLTRTLGAPAVATLVVTFPQVDDVQVCRVEVSRSRRPVFVRPTKTEQVLFYARIGNSTRELSVADAIDYAADHFAGPRRVLRRAR